jgi:thiol-disulfide isomerase/thioredoxin
MTAPGRRNLLLGGVAAAALGAGFGWSRWKERQAAEQAVVLWGMSFPQPDGGTLVMAERHGRPLLLNFWATWCAPCIKELPEIDRFHRDFAARGWQVVGLAVDGPTPVREFLQRRPVGFAIGMAGFEGTDLARTLGNESGSLPFSVLFDAQGRPFQRKLGQTHYAELAAWARSA